MIYLASPYTGNEEENYKNTEKVVASLLKAGNVIYSPIVHCHYLSLRHDLPGDIDFWHWYNEEMLKRADALWILMLEGWGSSKGIRFEYDIASQNNMPVSLISPENPYIVYPNFLGFTTRVES